MAATIPCQIDGWFGHRDILSLAKGGEFLVHLVKLEVYRVLSRHVQLLLLSRLPGKMYMLATVPTMLVLATVQTRRKNTAPPH